MIKINSIDDRFVSMRNRNNCNTVLPSDQIIGRPTIVSALSDIEEGDLIIGTPTTEMPTLVTSSEQDITGLALISEDRSVGVYEQTLTSSSTVFKIAFWDEEGWHPYELTLPDLSFLSASVRINFGGAESNWSLEEDGSKIIIILEQNKVLRINVSKNSKTATAGIRTLTVSYANSEVTKISKVMLTKSYLIAAITYTITTVDEETQEEKVATYSGTAFYSSSFKYLGIFSGSSWSRRKYGWIDDDTLLIGLRSDSYGVGVVHKIKISDGNATSIGTLSIESFGVAGIASNGQYIATVNSKILYLYKINTAALTKTLIYSYNINHNPVEVMPDNTGSFVWIPHEGYNGNGGKYLIGTIGSYKNKVFYPPNSGVLRLASRHCDVLNGEKMITAETPNGYFRNIKNHFMNISADKALYDVSPCGHIVSASNITDKALGYASQNMSAGEIGTVQIIYNIQ